MGTPRRREYMAVKKYSRTIYKLLDDTVDVAWFGYQLEHESFITAAKGNSALQSTVLTSHGKYAQLMDAVLMQIKFDKSGWKFKSFVMILRQQKSLLSAVYLLQQEPGLDLPDCTASPATPPTSGLAVPLHLAVHSDHSHHLSFSQLVASLIEVLENEDGALGRMKTTLDFFVLPNPKHAKGVTYVIPPQQYQSAETVGELLWKLVSHCFDDFRFLCLLVESSGCQEAIDKLTVFRDNAASVVGVQDPSASIEQEPAHLVSQNLHLPTPFQSSSTQPVSGLVVIEAKLDAQGLTQQAYSDIVTAVRRCLQLPGPAMRYCDTRHNPLILKWEISASLVSYVLSTQIAKTDILALSGLGVKELALGSLFQVAIPTLEYWERRTTAIESVSPEVTKSVDSSEAHSAGQTYQMTPDNDTEKGATAGSYPQHESLPYPFHKKININPSNYDSKKATPATRAREESQQSEQGKRLSDGKKENQTPNGAGREVSDSEDQSLHAGDSLNIPPGPQWEVYNKAWDVGGKRDEFLLGSLGTPSDGNPDVVPLQGDGVLADEDLQKLESQGIPVHCCDDLSILRARITLNPRVVSKRELISATGRELSRGHVLQQLEEFLNNAQEQGAVIHYIGHGKKYTGDWCFKDGFITFRHIIHLYNTTRIKGRALTLISNCSYSGSWVQECCRYLDEQGVAACGHAAAEKSILLKVFASCRPSEIASTLVFSTRGIASDKNTGIMYFFSNKELPKYQHTSIINCTKLRCGNAPQEPCCLKSPKYTWMKVYQGELIYLVRGEDKGRPAWYYIFLVDDNETIHAFNENLKSGTIDLENYGQILHSGFGKDPPNELADELEKQYGVAYM